MPVFLVSTSLENSADINVFSLEERILQTIYVHMYIACRCARVWH